MLRWDINETKKGGPFKEILDCDIFVNCIYLSKPIPPFLTKNFIKENPSNLSVIVDVSCDATNPNNPIPVYYGSSTFDEPLIQVDSKLDVIAIDHLPTLLPREASEFFVKDLMPTLINLLSYEKAKSWNQAEALFYRKCMEIK